MTLSIVIVSWNGKELLRDCLMSVFDTIDAAPRDQVSAAGATRDPVSSAASSFEVLVVDNGSTDGTPEMVRNEFPQVKLIANNYNAGFAKANNQAIKQLLSCHPEESAVTDDEGSPTNVGNLAFARDSSPPKADQNDKGAEFVLLLNQDMEVLPGTLQGMIDFMRAHSEAGVAGCHLVDKSGQTVPQVRRLPTVFDQAAIILKLPHLFPHLLDKYLMADFDYNKMEPQEVDSIRGSFFMIRRAVLEKVGGLDERFFFFFEEVDYCRRVKEDGWQVMYNPKVRCIDLVGQSVKKMDYQRQILFLESMVKYFKKWKPRWQWVVLDLLRPMGVVMVWAGDFILSLRGVRLGRTTKQSR